LEILPREASGLAHPAQDNPTSQINAISTHYPLDRDTDDIKITIFLLFLHDPCENVHACSVIEKTTTESGSMNTLLLPNTPVTKP